MSIIWSVNKVCGLFFCVMIVLHCGSFVSIVCILAIVSFAFNHTLLKLSTSLVLAQIIKLRGCCTIVLHYVCVFDKL